MLIVCGNITLKDICHKTEKSSTALESQTWKPLVLRFSNHGGMHLIKIFVACNFEISLLKRDAD